MRDLKEKFKILEHFRLKRKVSIILLFTIICITSCDSETANDCLQTDGDAITYEVKVPFFNRIQLENDVRLQIAQGPVQSVIVSTGENLVNDLIVRVEEDHLIIQNENGCNLFREFGRTLVTVTSPDIVFIRQASSFEIQSINTLTYPQLLIWSNTNPSPVGIDDPNKSGRVVLDIDIDDFRIQANGSSPFEISGVARNAQIIFSDEFPQIDARNLEIDNLSISHVGAANMIMHPINSITGQIRATGDVILVNEPDNIDVEELFTGRLIIE